MSTNNEKLKALKLTMDKIEKDSGATGPGGRKASGSFESSVISIVTGPVSWGRLTILGFLPNTFAMSLARSPAAFATGPGASGLTRMVVSEFRMTLSCGAGLVIACALFRCEALGAEAGSNPHPAASRLAMRNAPIRVLRRGACPFCVWVLRFPGTVATLKGQSPVCAPTIYASTSFPVSAGFTPGERNCG